MIRCEVHSPLLNVSFDWQEGSLLALTGPTGAGKTTLLRMLSGLHTPQQGYIAVAGRLWLDTQKGINLTPQQRSIGVVFQDYRLFPHMTIAEQLKFAVTGHSRSGHVIAADSRPGNAAADRIHFLLESLDLLSLQHHKPSKLSGGQQQRAALARALAKVPQLLLLDEPFSAQDPLMRRQMEIFLTELQKQENFNIVMITHDPGPVRHMADWVLYLQDGRIAQQGRPAELFARIYDIY